MKKIIVTLCSLALSLAGTFGANQIASNSEAIVDRNIEQESVEQDAEAIRYTTSLPANEKESKGSEKKEDKASEVEAAAPKAEIKEVKTAKEDKNTTVNNNDKKDNKKSVNKKDNSTKVNDTKASKENNVYTQKNTVSNSNEKSVINTTAKQNTDNNAVKQNNTTNNAANNNTQNNAIQNNTTQNNKTQNNTIQSKISDYANSFKSAGNNILVYKNVDLSNCESTQDVVEELQNNGYKNININNINNIGSLQDILSLICDDASQGGNNQPTPTKPAPTTVPTKPAPTTVPTKPAPTETPKPTPTTAPADNSGSSQSYANEVLRLVNIERSKAGLSSLTTNTTLKAAADKRAQETVSSFSHTRPNGSKFSTVLQEYGISYRTAGENIAYGQRSPEEVVNGWMNSPGHRANILNGSFNKIGIGVYQSKGVIYWSQLFTD